MKSNKKIVLAIVIAALLILVLLIVSLYKQLKDKKVMNQTPYDMHNAYLENRSANGESANDAYAVVVDNMNEYMTVSSIIEKFNQHILYLNGTAEDLDLILSGDEESKALAEYRQNGIKFFNDILANNYKTSYSVDGEYIMKALVPYSKKSYSITDMYVVKDSDYINTYFVYGKYENEEYNFIVVLDRYNHTYAVYLNNYVVDAKYSKDNTSTMKTLNIESITANNNNGFQYKNITSEQAINVYYDEYIELLKNNKQAAYSKLDSEYAKKRFGSIEKFNAYVNTLNYSQSKLYNFTTTQVNGYTEYVCKDMAGFTIIFKVTGVMKYTAMLDSYTTNVVAYENEYKNANEDRKIELSVNRFFEALNCKDYEAAYGFLNSNFKQEQFRSVEDLEKYVKDYWFNINSFTYKSMATDSSETVTVYGTISNYETEGSYDSVFIDKTFYMKLGKSYNDFEISFGK